MAYVNERTIRVLSMWQPWATLYTSGLKEYETRAWDTPVRGLVLIHATKHLERDVCIVNSFYRAAFAELGIVSPSQLPLGAIVGSVEIVATCRTDAQFGPRKTISQREDNFGDWSPDRFAWRARNARQCEPAPIAGRQGWWFVDQEFYDALVWHAK